MRMDWHGAAVKFRKFERPMGVVALALGVFSTAFTTYTQVTDAHQVSCQSDINQEFLTTLKTRASIGNENTKNINDFIIALINSKNNTPAEDQAVINSYLAKLAEINAELAKATYPDIPSCRG
jgi:hypothetical protein